MLDNAPFPERVRQSCDCATGLKSRKVIKEELILKMAVENYETNEAAGWKRVEELAAPGCGTVLVAGLPPILSVAGKIVPPFPTRQRELLLHMQQKFVISTRPK